jgi:cytochrome P450
LGAESTAVTTLREPRVIPGVPLIGNLIGFLGDPARTVLAAMGTHPGELLRLRLGPSSILVATDPDHIEHINVGRADNYWKGSLFNTLAPIFGRGLLLAEGHEWRQQRREMNPAFGMQCFRDIASDLTGIVEKSIEGWQDGETIDVDAAMRRLTMRLILRLMFSSSIDERVVRAMEVVFERMLRRFPLILVTAFIPGANRALLRSANVVLDREVAAILAARRAMADPPADLLTHLLRCRDEAGRPIDDRLIRDQVVTTIFGGYEATATAMHWMWLLLDKHPGVRDRVHAEIDVAKGFEDLVYGRQIASETLRLMPSFWESFRTAYADDDCGGFRIRAGESVLVSILSAHRDARYWQEPDRFDPDRFAPGYRIGHKAAYMPFLIGQRSCIGRHLAMGEMLLALWVIGRRFRLENADPDWPLRAQSAGTLRPLGAPKMIARRRR